MNHRLKKLGIYMFLLTLTVCLGMVSAAAAEVDSGKCGPDITWTLSDTGTLALSGEGYMYNYAPGKSPFANNSAIKKVTIGRGIISVGNRAFEGCKSLTSVSFSFPSDVEYIWGGAFRNCTGLTSITLPKSLVSISYNVFEGCSKLTSISVESSTMAYYYSVDGVVFQRDSSNTLELYPPGRSGAYTIPADTTSIDYGAFYHCTGLTTVTVHKDVKSFGWDGEWRQPFIGCTALTAVNVNTSNTAFSSSSNGILFDKNKTKLILYPAAKTGTTYTIPDTVTEIEAGAFTGAAKLTKITFGKGVTSVDDLDFGGCTNLTSFAVSSSNTSFTAVDGVLFSKDKTRLHRYPAGKSGAAAVAEGTTYINRRAFGDCAKVTSVAIPASLTGIHQEAFAGCRSLTAFSVDAASSSFRSEDGVLFDEISYDPRLVQYPTGRSGPYSIPEGVRSVGSYAFYDCAGLTEVTFSDSCGSIGSNAFENCTSLTAVDLNQATYISYRAFMGCSGLAAIELPVGVRTIYDSTFYDCASLASVTIPASVTSIRQSAFCGCEALPSVVLPSGLTTIEDRTFYQCRALESIVLPEGIQTIGDSAFSSSSLREITIPKSVSTIGDAFKHILPLKKIVFLGSAPTIDTIAFYRVTAMAYHPVGDETWTAEKCVDYYGDLTWQSWTCDVLGQEHVARVLPATAPTCTASGFGEGSCCDVCGTTIEEQEVIPAIDHKNKYAGEAKAATCTESGNTAGEYCPDCETWLTVQETIPATGHTYTDTGVEFLWATDLTSADASGLCQCGHLETAACALEWDQSGDLESGRLTVTASAKFGEQTFTDTKEITAVTTDDGEVTITLPNEIPGLKIIAAVYHNSGQMTECRFAEIDGNTASLVTGPGDDLRFFFLTSDCCPITS